MNEITLTAGLLSLLATAGLASAPAETPAGQAQTAVVLYQDIGYKKVSGHRLQKFQDIGNTFG